MALFACKICGIDLLQFEPNSRKGLCCPKCSHVEKVFDDLKKDLRDHEEKLNRIRHATINLLQTFPLVKGEDPVLVKAADLKELWNAVELVFHTSDVDHFLSRNLNELTLICEAFSLFRKKDRGVLNRTFEEKLKALFECCEKLRQFNKWEDSKFDLPPEEILKGLK